MFGDTLENSIDNEDLWKVKYPQAIMFFFGDENGLNSVTC